jgi:hypothetical protein
MFEISTVHDWMSSPTLVIRPEASIGGAHEVIENEACATSGSRR